MEATEETTELVERVAALDIGKAVLTACIRIPHESTAGRRRQEVAEYATTTAALLRLADRMRELGVTRVAMEATSDYWKPVFYLLEAMRGDVGTPRPVARRVAQQFWGHSFEALLGPDTVHGDRRQAEVAAEVGGVSMTIPSRAAANAREWAFQLHGEDDGGEQQIQHDAAARATRRTPDTDLVELAHVLDQRGISGGALTAAELTCERLDQQFARLGPDEVLSQVCLLMGAVLGQLRGPQSLGHQRRLVTLAGRLAGLRAWGCFDIDEHGEAERWYDVAVTAAQEAEAWSLGAWLLGAQSLIPWHRRDHRRTVALLERGIYFAGRGTDSTTSAWLHALEARGRASLGDRHGFETTLVDVAGAENLVCPGHDCFDYGDGFAVAVTSSRAPTRR
jgi:hypothetical protein